MVFPLLAGPAQGGGGGWPDETTTGVPSGTSLTAVPSEATSGTGWSWDGSAVNSTGAGVVIENLNITGALVVGHANVTVRKCKVLTDALFTGGVDGVTVEDCEISSDPNWNTCLVIPSGATNHTIQRCNIYAAENAIVVNGTGHTISDNYMHSLAWPYSPDPHIDAIQAFPSAASMTISGNNIVDPDGTWSSLITLSSAGDNMTVTANRLIGGAYGLRAETTTNGLIVTNNRFGEPHAFGHASLEGAVSPTISGNVDDATGDNIDADLLP